MQKASDPRARRLTVLIFLIAALIVAADQLTKAWIRTYPQQQPVFEAGFFRIVHIHNTGAAFGLFQGSSLALAILAMVGIIIFIVYIFFAYRRFPFLDNIPNRVAMGLILGGTLGNLIDRLSTNFGGVTDFISIGPWPAFNVADSAVTVGAILFAFSLLRSVRTENR